MRRFNLSDWAVHHQALVLFFIVAVSLAGFFSYLRLGRSEDPSFTIKLAVVTVIWPGATALEMQSQVAEPMEKKLQELPYYDRVQTYSKPGFAAMQVFFKDSTPAKEVPYLFYLTRKKLVDMQGEQTRIHRMLLSAAVRRAAAHDAAALHVEVLAASPAARMVKALRFVRRESDDGPVVFCPSDSPLAPTIDDVKNWWLIGGDRDV